MPEEKLKIMIRDQWESWKELNGRYPTCVDIDNDFSLVTTKTIQRRFGGVTKLRKELGYTVTDYTMGEVRSAVASQAISESVISERKLSCFLYEYFGKRPNVCLWETYTERSNFKSDFGVYYKDGGHFFVDIFYARSLQSVKGCILAKMKKIEASETKEVVYLVCSNENITQGQLEAVRRGKKKDVPTNVVFITLGEFKKEIEKYRPLVPQG